MVRAAVNGEELGVNTEGLETIGDLLQRLEVHVPPRELIVSLRINGGECDSDPASQIRALPVLGVEQIELETQSPENFAAGARVRVGEYLGLIRGKLERAVECFDKEADSDGWDYYRLGIEELRGVVELWGNLQQIGTPDLAAEDGMKTDLQLTCDHLETVQKSNDLAAVRDAIADRLLPLLERWQIRAAG